MLRAMHQAYHLQHHSSSTIKLNFVIICKAPRHDNTTILTQDNVLILVHVRFHLSLGGQRLGRRASLRSHVLDDAVGIPGAVVVLRLLSVAEDLQGGVAADAMLATNLRLSRAVNLDKGYRGVISSQNG